MKVGMLAESEPADGRNPSVSQQQLSLIKIWFWPVLVLGGGFALPITGYSISFFSSFSLLSPSLSRQGLTYFRLLSSLRKIFDFSPSCPHLPYLILTCYQVLTH